MGRLVFGSPEAREIAKKNRELEAVDRAAKLAGIELPSGVTDAKDFFNEVDNFRDTARRVEELEDELRWAESDLRSAEHKFKKWGVDAVDMADWWDGVDLHTRDKLLKGKF